MRTQPWHRNLAAVFVAQAMTMVAISFVMPFFPLYIQELGVEGTGPAATWAGVAIGAAAFSMAVAQPFWGNLSDRFGRRPMVIRSMLGAGTCIALMGFVNSPEQLVAMRFIQGLLSGSIAAGNALIATSTPEKSIGLAMGLMQIALFSGSSIGPLAGGLIAGAWGYRTCFYMAGGLMILGGILVLLFAREHFVKPAPGTKQPSVLASTKALFGIALFGAIMGVILLTQFGGTVMQPVLTLFVAELVGNASAPTTVGTLSALQGAMAAVAAVIVGRVGDRVGHSRILPICLVGATVAYVIHTFVQDIWQLFVLRAVLACFLGGLMPTSNAMLVRIVPMAMRGSAFGISGAVTSAAGAIGPVMGGGIAALAGLRAVFVVSAALYAAGFAWVAVEFRRHAANVSADDLALAGDDVHRGVPTGPP